MTQQRFNGPGADIIERKARAALDNLPDQFRAHLTDIVIRVEEFAERDMLDSVGLEGPWNLVGLYRGHPVNKQSVWASGDMPPTIFVFRQPLLARQKQTGASLDEVINHLVVHEVGHHFGFSDADMHAIEDGPSD